MITIATDSKTLKDHLRKAPVKYSYIYFGHNNPEVVKLLKENSDDEMNIEDCSESFREEFFKAYVDLIGSIGARLNSIYWWASFTASKNRFISKLLQTLFAYYSVCRAIRKNPEKSILLVNPPRGMVKALKRHCNQNLIAFKNIDYPHHSYYKLVKDGFEHFMRIIYYLLNSSSRIFYARKYFRKNFDKNHKVKDYYVLRTWVYPTSITESGGFSDSFFGRLPEFLSSKKGNLLVMAGIIGDYKTIASRLSKCKDYFIVPQEFFLKYSDPVKSALDCYFHRIKLKDTIVFYGLDVTEIIQEELDRDYTRYTRNELIQRYVIKNMLEYFSINTFAVTYENNPWERLCLLTVKEFSSSTMTIGYQHAVVTRASANMFPSRNEINVAPMPDKIITVGEVTKRAMEKYGCYPNRLIRPSCALRHEYLYKLRNKEIIKNKSILVALEGVPECYKLVNFVYTALSFEDYFVTIRTHPERPFEKIRKDICFDISTNKNFSISTQTLKNDLDAAGILIYWGSTVALEALMMGIPVVHVNLNDIISVDPLFECNHLKWTVRTAEELKKAITEIYNLSQDNYTLQYRKARAYIEDYLRKPTDERLCEFII